LSVVPPSQTFGPEPVVGTEFDVNIKMNQLDKNWKLIGVQFRLDYDALLVEPVSVTEGPYMTDPYYAPYGTFFVSYFETIPQPHVLVGDLILPDGMGNWNPPFLGGVDPDYVNGSGIIATIRFRIIQQIYPMTMVGDFHLWDELAVDPDANEIPNDPSIDGTVTILTTPLPGRVIDVFTQYPAPFGGQGPDMPSDMYWPQKEVWLYANVTYNWWPMQQKLVGFEVEDPNGAVWAKLSNVTDVNGQAWVKFRLPWPCDNPESLFGVWHITATVDVACIVINDTLDFHYDYQARLWKVTIDPPPCENDMNFAHCDIVTLHIDYGTHSQQLIPALISVVLYDEVGCQLRSTSLS